MTLFMTLQTINLQAAEIKGVVFDDSLNLGEISLPLRGTGLLKYLVLFNAYVAAFYLPEGVPSQKALSDVPKCLEIQYFHEIKAKDFAASTSKLIADNQSPETVAALKPRIEKINELYEDVKPGDRYALTYIPGIGTELALNGEAKGTIQGADFAVAIFSIWLGSNPLDKKLKKQLLGTP
jgi:hypothetical protein